MSIRLLHYLESLSDTPHFLECLVRFSTGVGLGGNANTRRRGYRGPTRAATDSSPFAVIPTAHHSVAVKLLIECARRRSKSSIHLWVVNRSATCRAALLWPAPMTLLVDIWGHACHLCTWSRLPLQQTATEQLLHVLSPLTLDILQSIENSTACGVGLHVHLRIFSPFQTMRRKRNQRSNIRKCLTLLFLRPSRRGCLKGCRTL
mmetsp:Transcript_75209/g.141918  ORF Transcript_75209/g.141918 Transcript_75209/m.141918 type:complete len:204 (-) Transcript_75209:236-847(-)